MHRLRNQISLRAIQSHIDAWEPDQEISFLKSCHRMIKSQSTLLESFVIRVYIGFYRKKILFFWFPTFCECVYSTLSTILFCKLWNLMIFTNTRIKMLTRPFKRKEKMLTRPKPYLYCELLYCKDHLHNIRIYILQHWSIPRI